MKLNESSEQYKDKLKSIALFEALKENEEAMNKILAITSLRTFNSGEYIIKEGEMGDELFILLEGAVDILKKTMAGDDYVVASLKAEYNIFIGELALIDNDRRSASVVTTEESEVLVIGKEDFMGLGNSDPHIGLSITRVISKILSGRLRKTNDDMMTLFNALVTEVQD